MTIITEGGLRPSRIEFVPEPRQGVTPNDPDWRMPSERVSAFNPGFAINYSEDSGLGDIDYSRQPIMEENEMEMSYSLQKGQWICDSDGNPQGMAAYGIMRTAGILSSSLTVVRRMSSGKQTGSNAPKLQPSSTVDARYNPEAASDGADSTPKASRTYAVLKGVDVNEGTLTAERGEATVLVELTCPAERGRSYQIDQPPSGPTTLAVKSTNPADTGMQVSMESEDMSSAELVSLNSDDATNVVATTTEFSDIDAIEVYGPDEGEDDPLVGEGDADYQGNIVVGVDTGDPESSDYSPAMGEWLSVLWGNLEYGNTHGDEGIPLLAGGSHADPISGDSQPDYYSPQNIGIERPPGEAIEHAGGVQTLEAEFSNNIERTPSGGREQIQHHGMRALEATVAMFGETVSSYFQRIAQSGQGATTRFLFGRNNPEHVDWVNAVISEIDMETSAGENSLEREATVMGRQAADGGPAVDVSSQGSSSGSSGSS